MLRNIIIMATSGLVLFTKEFANSIAQPRMVGSLITAIIEFGNQSTGMGVSYIELSNVSVSIVINEGAKIFCALFYDREDGVVFGRLLCREILHAFNQEYSSDFTQFGRNLKDFYGFHKKIPNIVRISVKPVLQQLAMAHECIKKVVLVSDREIIDITISRVDSLSMLANLNALTDLCFDTMAGVSDGFQHLSMDTAEARLLIWRVQEVTTLIVAVDLDATPIQYSSHTDEALEIIEQVCLLYDSLIADTR